MFARSALALLLLANGITHAQESVKATKYPHVNLATVFEVDAKWPQRPAELYWAAVSGIAVDKNDHVYVLTRTRQPVQIYDAAGKLLRTWGTKEIARPHQIRIDSEGNLWITDIDLHVVMKFSPDGKLLQTLGVRDKAGRDNDHFNMPTDVAFGPKGDIYVSDGYGNHRVVQFDKSGKFLRTWGELGHKAGQFSIPHSIACDSKGRVYVADRNNVRVQVFDADGRFIDAWREVVTPWGLAMSKNDELWVCGSSPMQWRPSDEALGCPPHDQVVMRFKSDGRLAQLVRIPKGNDGLEGPGDVNWVHCIAFDSRGNMYLGDIIGKRAQKFTPRHPAGAP